MKLLQAKATGISKLVDEEAYSTFKQKKSFLVTNRK